MSKQVIVVNKPIGKTPLEMVELFKKKHPEYAEITVSYAGRLDPMAHGLLLLLVGEENKKREQYLHLDKTYEVEILFGFETDTYDVLGKIIRVEKVDDFAKDQIEKEIKKFIGKKEQEYPPYSSKAVQGKPLFWWARNSRLDEITIPKRDIEIYDSNWLAERKVRGEELLEDIKDKIKQVKGNFRQEEISKQWEESVDKNFFYMMIKVAIHCSSGTYMRSLADELGKKLGFGAVAYDIYRTHVGKYSIE